MPENSTITAQTGEMSWYVVHTYSGYENKAKLALEERIKSCGIFAGEVQKEAVPDMLAAKFASNVVALFLWIVDESRTRPTQQGWDNVPDAFAGTGRTGDEMMLWTVISEDSVVAPPSAPSAQDNAGHFRKT